MSRPFKPIDEIVDTAAAEGDLHSKGSFTLSTERAWIMLGRAQLPSPENWLSKVVQAAVAAEADAVKVKQLRRRTVVEFSGCHAFSPETFILAMQVPGTQAPRAIEHLSVGLRSLATQNGRSFALTLLDGRKAYAQFWGGDAKLEHLIAREPSTPSTRVRLEVDFPPGEFGRIHLGLSQGTELALNERGELFHRAVCAPVSVKLDGWEVANLGLQNWHFKDRPQRLPLLLEGLLPIDPSFSEKGLKVPLSVVERSLSLFRAESSIANFVESVEGGADGEYLALAVVSFHSQGPIGATSASHIQEVPTPSYCYWVLDGVVIDQEPLSRGMGGCALELYLSAEGLSVDLTTFGIIDNQDKSDRLKKVMKLVRDRLSSWSGQEGFVFKQSRGSYLAAGLLAGGLMVAHPATALLGLTSVVSSLAMLIRGSRPNHNPPEEMLQEALQGLVQSLSGGEPLT